MNLWIKNTLVVIVVIVFGLLLISTCQINDRITVLFTYTQCQVDLLKNIAKFQWEENSKIMASIEAQNNKIKKIEEVLSNSPLTLADVSHMVNGNVIVDGVMGIGAGTIIGKAGNAMYILTCYHVIDYVAKMNEKGIPIQSQIGYPIINQDKEGKGMVSYPVTIVKQDEKNDLALLKIEIVDDTLEVIKLADTTPSIGDTVFSVGSPLGMIRTLSKGVISNFIEGFYISDNTCTFGNSGGGLYNRQGELIGVPAQVTGYGTTVEGNFVPESSLGFAINLKRIKEFLKDTF